jgi:catechol 2,3-dioxygenase-like lactoylglutathione lyase family enzyme
MLSQARPVGFISTTDPDRARTFYEGALGLSLEDDGFALVAQVGGGVLRITTLPEFAASPHPAFGFMTEDLRGVAGSLAGKGVAFERYAFLGDAQDADGIWTGPNGTQLAWFKDPDGNLLTLGS